MRVMVHDLVVKIAPDQLGEPDFGTAVAGLHALPGLARQSPDRDRAKAQVHAQIARTFDCRVVSGCVVAIDAVEEIVEQIGGAPAAALQLRAQPCRLKTDGGQAGYAIGQIAMTQRSGQRLDLKGLEVARRQAAQPAVFVGRENAVGFADRGQHLAALENYMVLEAVQRAAAELLRHLRVAQQGGRLIVVVVENGLHAQLHCQFWNQLGRATVANDQARCRVQAPQVGIDNAQGIEDEFDPPVGARQGVEDVRIEHKGAVNLSRRLQRMVQRRVVLHPQIAAQPDQNLVKHCLFHSRSFADE